MQISGWGRFPIINATMATPLTRKALRHELGRPASPGTIARGLGRSYGDSALAPHVISMLRQDHFLAFDTDRGILRCQAGASLADIIAVVLPAGWFPAVTPGTKFVTVGGAIASDVHGKNHHLGGCFSDHVESFRLMLASGEVVECSRDAHADLFRATCGGMGLTGVILDATLRLTRIHSAYIRETTLKTASLTETLELFDAHRNSTYSVAWLDCLAAGARLGRSLIMLGEHAEDGPLALPALRPLSVPVDMPGITLNRFSIAAFNFLYYHRVRKAGSERLTTYEPFFYPLDRIHNWNRIYGRSGFTQYQFVLPKQAGLAGMQAILHRVARSKRGSFLAVLKVFGKQNDNPLSFPVEGCTAALDFKLGRDLFPLLDELDRVVLDHGGRVYLTKDVRMSEAAFKRGYPRWEEFAALREQYGARDAFASMQSRRLGL